MTEREAITDDERSSAMRARRAVRSALKSFRATAKNPDEAVRYTQGQHVALQETLALQMFTISRLVDRIERLEARPAVKYCGVWSPDREYEADNQVTHAGGLWIAKGCSKNCRPGKSPDLWHLCVKSGRAG